MRPETGEGVTRIVGREPELTILAEFAAAGPGGGALVLKGGPGVGKTTLWEVGRDAGLAQGMRVLSARPSSAETGLSYAGLTDLLDGVEPGELSGMPGSARA